LKRRGKGIRGRKEKNEVNAGKEYKEKNPSSILTGILR
jgi:hypothetical protein